MTRASDAARDAATERLKDAYVRGALNIEAFQGRVSEVLVAATVDDLASLTSDVPGDTRALEPVPPTPAPASWNQTKSRRKRVWIAALVIGGLAGGCATAIVNHERNIVPSHCLVMGKSGQFHRLC
jgi:Domain of unknown function (DUF1707)